MANRATQVNGLSLAEQLAEQIRNTGPMPFRDWMWHALYDPVQGYYVRPDRRRWGREGDYRTSPQRSELFAATFARYFAGLYDNLDRPEEWMVLEAGAGDGNFAEGVLFTLRDEFPDVFSATRYVVDEISPDSRLRLTERLGTLTERVSFASLGSMEPVAVGVVFSNELIDAFPVHLVTTANGNFSEVHVALDENERFVFAPCNPSTSSLLQFCSANGIQPSEGQVIEINLAVEEWLAQVARVMRRGYLVTVDYGAEAEELHSRLSGTLRGYARHSFVDDVLAAPGECDLTSSINWTQVKKTGALLGLELVEFLQQDQFLLQEGALVELQTRLDKISSDAARLQLTTAARDLILPSGMSSSYQVLVQRRQ